MWEYQAKITRIVDGDTYYAMIDVGFYMRAMQELRHAYLDTNEVYGRNASEEGQEEAEFVGEWVMQAREEHDGEWPFVIETGKDTGSFGRWLATVKRKSDGEMLGEAIQAEFPDRDLLYED